MIDSLGPQQNRRRPIGSHVCTFRGVFSWGNLLSIDEGSQNESFNNIHVHPKTKSRIALSDLNDVTLGSPAIFQKQDNLKEAQRGILIPVAFRPHLTMGLVFHRGGLSSQQANYAY